jgi:hypothetical protein
LSALCHEVAFKLFFKSEILDMRHKGSLTLDTPISGNAAFMNHAGYVVRLGFKPWKGSVIYARLNEGGRENGTVEKAMIPRLWNSVVQRVEGQKKKRAGRTR